MPRRVTAKSTRGFAVFAACVAMGFLFLGQPAWAGEQRIGGKNISTIVDAQYVEVGDVEGHVLGRYEGKGVTIGSDGETSTFIQSGAFDYVKGAGAHKGYLIRTFSDGAMTTSTYRGTTEHTDKGRKISGTWELVSGTERLEGATGKGTYEGHSTEIGMNIIDWEGTMTVPTD